MPHFLNHRNHPVARHLLGAESVYARKLAEHESLEEELAVETRRPYINWDHIKSLKRRKLRIAEDLARLSGS